MEETNLLTLVVSKDKKAVVRLARSLATGVMPVDNVAGALQIIERCTPSCVIVDFTIGREEALWLSHDLTNRFPGMFSVGCLDSLNTLIGS